MSYSTIFKRLANVKASQLLHRSVDLQLVWSEETESLTSGWRARVEVGLLAQRSNTGSMSRMLASIVPASNVVCDSVSPVSQGPPQQALITITNLLSQMALVLGVHLNRT